MLPDLLRKYLGQFPLSPIWLGVFAGVRSPIRVLTDQQGLGRIVAKSLLADPDFEFKPSCDIAFEEISRWLGSDTNANKVSLRGMASRTLNIELFHGVTCPFAVGRLEGARGEGLSATTQSKGEPHEGVRTRLTATVSSSANVLASIEALARRVEVLEKTIAEADQPGKNTSADTQSETDLLGDKVPTSPDAKPPKKSKWRR